MFLRFVIIIQYLNAHEVQSSLFAEASVIKSFFLSFLKTPVLCICFTCLSIHVCNNQILFDPNGTFPPANHRLTEIPVNETCVGAGGRQKSGASELRHRMPSHSLQSFRRKSRFCLFRISLSRLGNGKRMKYTQINISFQTYR